MLCGQLAQSIRKVSHPTLCFKEKDKGKALVLPGDLWRGQIAAERTRPVATTETRTSQLICTNCNTDFMRQPAVQ